jgi:PAS domain S-box-containing protein
MKKKKPLIDAEQDARKAHIFFLESLGRVDQAIKRETDIEQMLRHILETVFSIFDCDRVWLFYPCDPDAPMFRVPMEITKPAYPGAKVLNVDMPMSPDMAQNLREALASPDPVIYIAGTEKPINKVTAEIFGVQSQMFVALYPKLGKPWVFGMHQCSYPRIWTKDEKKLFTEIARRISDGLSSVLFLRELQENEERFRATFEQAAVGIGHAAPDGRLLRVNQKMCDVLGYSREELLQKTFQDITYHEDIDASKEHVRRLLAREVSTYSIEKRYVSKDGTPIWVDLTVSLARTPSGDIAYLIGVFEDISKRKLTEQSLEENRNYMRTLLLTIPDLVWMKDVEGVYLSCNRMFERLYGASEMEIIGKTDYDFVSKEQADFFLEHDRIAASAGKPSSNEEWLTFADNGYHGLFETIKTPIYTEEGKLIGVLGIARDITQRKREEEVLRKNAQLLRRAEEVAKFGSWEFILDKNEVHASEGAWILYGLEPNEWIIPYVQQVPLPEYRPMLDKALKELIGQGMPYNIEFKIRRPADGKIIDIHSIAEYDAEKNVVFGVIQDITDRKRAEEEQEKLQTQLLQAQKMESVGRLAGGVAHDFNNMLGVILGHAELALQQVGPAEPLRDNLSEIRKAGQRAADLTRQLLAFARKQTVSPQILKLNDLVANMLSMLRRLIGENIELAWLPGEELWPIKMDPSQVDQILANLCVNARDACVVAGKITIETRNVVFDEGYCAIHTEFLPGEYVQLVVSDSGCGMEKEVLDNLFEPFFTTKGTGKGTGLGLSTVYGIVKQNMGFINVYSEPSAGATFKIYLPRSLDTLEQVSEGGRPLEIAGGTETILLVEDEPALLNMSREMLENFGYRVLAAGTPKEALQLAEKYAGEIDLLVTDVVMPGMTGWDLSKRLLSLYPKLKQLFMSGYTADIIADHGILEEGMTFLQKPFSPKNLSIKVREALGKKE